MQVTAAAAAATDCMVLCVICSLIWRRVTHFRTKAQRKASVVVRPQAGTLLLLPSTELTHKPLIASSACLRMEEVDFDRSSAQLSSVRRAAFISVYLRSSGISKNVSEVLRIARLLYLSNESIMG